MTDRESLLYGVLTSPDDDLPRLVFADWAEENGDPARAEFIRLQIQLTRLADGSRVRRDLQRRAEVLLAEHGDRWRQELPAWVRSRSRVVYRRGFPYQVSTTALAFLRGAPGLFASAPIESVDLDRVGDHLADLGASPELGRLRRLGLRCNGLRADDLRTLLVNPALANLRGLDLGFNELGPAGGEALAGAVGLSNLTDLGLAGCSLGDDGAGGLSVAARLGSVRRLNLQLNRVGDAGAVALAKSPYLNRLEKLNLLCNPIGPAARYKLQERFGGVVWVSPK